MKAIKNVQLFDLTILKDAEVDYFRPLFRNFNWILVEFNTSMIWYPYNFEIYVRAGKINNENIELFEEFTGYLERHGMIMPNELMSREEFYIHIGCQDEGTIYRN